MAKRISDIAKELGVQSKAIIEKCLAEGVPADKVKGHMSTVSAGLELSIREWFASGEGSVATAVETSAHPNIEKVRAPNRRPSRAKAKAGKSDEDEGLEHANGTATVEPPAVRRPPARKTKPDHEEASGPTAEPFAPSAPATEETAGERAHATPAAHPAAAPAAPGQEEISPAPSKAAARAPEATEHGGGHGPTGGATKAAHHPRPHLTPVKSAPMNVPTRPKTVAPAGPQLEQRAAVKLAGPKVVRIEAPEMVDRPKPRRDSMGDTGRSAGGGVGMTRDDEERGQRRGGAGTASRRRDTGAGASARGGGAGGGGASGGVPARRKGRTDEASFQGGMWREQDLAEREARLSRASGFLKARRQQLRKAGHPQGEQKLSAAETGGLVHITAPFTIKDLSAATGVKSADIIKKLFMQGVMATVNSGIDPAKAQEIMIDFDIELEVSEAKSAEEIVSSQFTDRQAVDERSRGPIVTILGHVDHGKTSLLDKIRNANVAAGEAGGITQATSAFRTPVVINGETKYILFLDTPGHEAFTSMRARGAAITDVVVLVVSAPEGVMPQTIESINHAKAAGVPIVVALNKIDRPDATDARINQTLGELAAQGLNPIEWGGETEVIRTSATKGTGIDKLLEVLDLQGQVLDLKADYGGPARGTVVEAKMEEGRGPVANVIVQDGNLKVGDFIVVGRAYGKVRDIVDDRGERHKTQGPATVARISGFDELPNAGDKFYIVESLKQAQDAAEQRRQREREAQLAQPKVTLDSLLSQMKESESKEILVVVKADVQGSVDVLKHEIEKVKTEEVKVRVLHAAVGGITESDVVLADASKAIIIGFNVIASSKARQLAEAKGVEIRTYQVIYEITDDIRKAAEGLLAPEMKTTILGHAEVRRVFKVSKVGTIAGCFVTDGVVERDALIRVTRNGIVIENDRRLEQLKRVKDDAKEVRAGLECGMKIVGYDDIKEGDVLECYKNVEVKRTL